jgi:hypothetical protein
VAPLGLRGAWPPPPGVRVRVRDLTLTLGRLLSEGSHLLLGRRRRLRAPPPHHDLLVASWVRVRVRVRVRLTLPKGWFAACFAVVPLCWSSHTKKGTHSGGCSAKSQSKNVLNRARVDPSHQNGVEFGLLPTQPRGGRRRRVSNWADRMTPSDLIHAGCSLCYCSCSLILCTTFQGRNAMVLTTTRCECSRGSARVFASGHPLSDAG